MPWTRILRDERLTVNDSTCKSVPHLSVHKAEGRTTARHKRHQRLPVFGPALNSCLRRTPTPISGHHTEQEVHQRTVERAKQVRGSSYSLLEMRREAAAAVEYCESRPRCERQIVCMGAAPKKWASAWSGKEVVEQRVSQRERDLRALVCQMLEGCAVGSAGRSICV